LHKFVLAAGGCPLVVHCSAGIGRTGTFCSMDVLFGQLKTKKIVPDVLATVKALRCQRLFSVQNEAQYTFIYRVMIDYLANIYKVPVTNPALQVRFGVFGDFMILRISRISGQNTAHCRRRYVDEEE
jgi:hypothetical protein